MPGIKDSQLPELHAEGLRELTARMLTAAASIVGKAQIPSTISINPQVVLEMATFGLFQNWHDSDRKLFEDECSKILFNTLHSTGFVLSSGSPLQLDLPDETSKETILTRIMTADPSNPSKNLEAALSRPPSLFDDNV
jgi:hypothetical protein